MTGILRVKTAPAALVTAAEVKAQTRVDTSADDTLIGEYILAASEAIDGPLAMAGRAFAAQKWDYVLPDFYAAILVPVPGATSVDTIVYRDAADLSQTLTTANYYRVIPRDDGLLLERKANIETPVVFDRTDAVTITVNAGGTVPKRIKQAALLTAANWYEDREIGNVPQGAQLLVNLERNGWFGA